MALLNLSTRNLFQAKRNPLSELYAVFDTKQSGVHMARTPQAAEVLPSIATFYSLNGKII